MDRRVRLRGNGIALVSLPLIVLSGRTIESAPPPELEAFTFLLGEWEVSGQGPGEATGRTVFSLSLQERVIVRTNYADYPASADKGPTRHDDFMVVYAVFGGAVRADYYDSEGHVLHYSVTSPAVGEAVFVSDRVAGEPRYRLSYKLGPGGPLNGEFAIAPPGQPEAFQRYLAWQSTRQESPPKDSAVMDTTKKRRPTG